jgi:hypothetical protein
VSTSSNISMRPRFRAVTRMSDSVTVLINLDLVRVIAPIAGGVRLSFGNAASDSVDIIAVSLAQLQQQMDP